MAYKNKEIIDLKGIMFLMLMTLPSIATTILDCYGKAFHCVNSTHFMICVDLGTGISTTIDEFIIPCPPTTVCRSTNHFECEFPAPAVLPIDRSTVATIKTSDSEVVSSNSLVTTSIPYEEYFNTLSSTTLSQSDLQLSTTDSIFSVYSVSSTASTSETVITTESILKDGNVQPGSTAANNPEISVTLSDVNSNVENNVTLNLNAIPYETTTSNNIHEITTTIDIESQLQTGTTGLTTLVTTYNNLQNIISTDNIRGITEPTPSTTELYTKDFQEPLTISDHFSITTESIMTAEPIAEVREILNAQNLETNINANEPVGYNYTSSHSETHTNSTSENHMLLGNPSITTPNLQLNQTITPHAITGMNQEQFTNTSKSDTQYVTDSFIFKTETPLNVATTETIIIDGGENVTTPDYEVTVDHPKEVIEVVNVTKSDIELLIKTATARTTDAHPNTESLAYNSYNENVNNKRNVATLYVPTTTTYEGIYQEITTKNNLETLNNSSSILRIELELTTDNITKNLQYDAEHIVYDHNHLLVNTTDKMLLNEKVFFTNFEDNKASTAMYKSDLDNNTETSAISEYTSVQDNESTTNRPQPSMDEKIKKDYETNVDIDVLYKTIPQSENASQDESVTLFTSPPLSTFTVDASDRPIIDNTHQLNDNTNTGLINDDVSFAYTDPHTLTTKMPSTTIRNSVPNSSRLKEDNFDQVRPREPNKLIVTSVTEEISLTPPTAALDLHKMSSTKYIGIPHTNVITIDTSSPTTNINTSEAPYTTPNNIATNKTNGFSNTTIKYGEDIEKTPLIPLPSQSTPSMNDFITPLDPLTVETNSINNSINIVMTDGNNGSIVSNRTTTQNQISLGSTSGAAFFKEESAVSINIVDKIDVSAGTLNDTNNNLTERNIMVTTESVYTHSPEIYYTVVPTEAIETNIFVDGILEKNQETTTQSHVPSKENTDTVQTIHKPVTSSTHNVGKKDIQQSLSEIPISVTEVNYDTVGASSTDTTLLLDLVKNVSVSTSESDVSLSTKIVVEAITHDMIKNVPQEVDINQGDNTDRINTLVLSTNTLREIYTDISTTPGDVLFENSTITQALRPTLTIESTVTTENISFAIESIASTENTLWRYPELEAQPATDTPDLFDPTAIPNTALKENLFTAPASTRSSYLISETNPLKDVKLTSPNEPSSVATNVAFDASHTQSDNEGDNYFARTASFPNNVTTHKPSNVSLVDDVESNVLNQALSVKLPIESKNINYDLKPQILITGNKETTAAFAINDIPVTGFPNNVETITRNSYNTQSQLPGDVDLGRTKTINASENKVNHVPLNSKINNANDRFGTGSYTQPVISEAKNIEITTSNNRDIIITELLDASLANGVSNISNPKTPHVSSNLIKTNITKDKQNMSIIVTSRTDLIEEPRGTIVESTPSLSSIESVTYPMQKPITQADDKFISQDSNIEMPETIVSAAQTSDVSSSYQSKDGSKYVTQGTTTQSIKDSEKSITRKSVSEKSSFAPNESQIQNAVLIKPLIVIGVTEPIILDRFNVANTNTVNSITATDTIFPLDSTETTRSVIDSKIETLNLQSLQSNLESQKTSDDIVGDVTSTGLAGNAPKPIEKDLMKTTEKSQVLQPSLGLSTEMSTGSNVLVDNNMESDNTHSGIISIITNVPPVRDLDEKKESEFEIRSEMPMLEVKDPVTQSVEYTSTPSQNNNISTREKLLIKTESNDYKSATDNDGLNKPPKEVYSGKINNDNGTKITGSEIKKETPTRELLDISVASTNDSHTSNNKSKDQIKGTFDAHKITAISNDKSGTPRYMSQTKSTATSYKPTEFPPFQSTTPKPKAYKFTCKSKKRGRYADEVDCRKFYICLGNSHVVEGTCPNNTVFSEIRKQCTTNLSHCVRNNQFRCITEGHFSDFINDNVYYICVKNNLKFSSFIRFKLICQNGYHLNRTSVRCVLNENSKESTSNSDNSKNNSDQSAYSAITEEKNNSVKKFKCKKEGIFADRTDCTRYFECRKTDSTGVYRQKRKKCGGDKIFSRDKKRCVDGESDECNSTSV